MSVAKRRVPRAEQVGSLKRSQRLIAANDTPPHVDKVLSKPPRLAELRAAFVELLP